MKLPGVEIQNTRGGAWTTVRTARDFVTRGMRLAGFLRQTTSGISGRTTNTRSCITTTTHLISGAWGTRVFRSVWSGWATSSVRARRRRSISSWREGRIAIKWWPQRFISESWCRGRLFWGGSLSFRRDNFDGRIKGGRSASVVLNTILKKYNLWSCKTYLIHIFKVWMGSLHHLKYILLFLANLQFEFWMALQSHSLCSAKTTNPPPPPPNS